MAKKSAGSTSLERGLIILNILDQSRTPVGIRELSRQAELSAPAVQRLVNTFVQHGYAIQDEETKKYSIGYRAINLGSRTLAADALFRLAQAELNTLAQDHELNGYLGKRHGDMAVYLLCVQSRGPVAIRNTPGELTYLHSTAMGKVLLSGMRDDEAYRLLTRTPLEAVTEKTITDPDTLLDQLAEIRRSGYAWVREETLLGVVSVGAPIYSSAGAIEAALSVAFAESIAPQHTIEAAAELIQTSALHISRELGWTG